MRGKETAQVIRDRILAMLVSGLPVSVIVQRLGVSRKPIDVIKRALQQAPQ